MYLQISELVSHTVPTVLSNFTAMNFEYEGRKVGCIGTTDMAFKKCVLDMYTNKSYWDEVHKEGLAYVKKKHERATIKATWSKILSERYEFIRNVREQDNKN